MTKTLRTTIISLIYTLSLIFAFLGLYKFFLIFLILIGVLGIKKEFCSIRFVLIGLLISALSLAYVNFKKPIPDYLSKIEPTNAYISGRVLTFPEFKSNRSVKFEMLVNSIKNGDKSTKISTKTLVRGYRFPDKNKIKIGDDISFEANIKKPIPATNPGEFDYKKYLENKRIFTISYITDNSAIKVSPPKELKWKALQEINELKVKIIKEHSKHLKSPYLELLGGMVFGDDAVVPPEQLKNNFLKSGLLHVLAASGMNVGFIFIAWYTLSQFFRLPYKPSIIIGGVLVLIYSCMTGFPPSIARAALMIELVLIGKLFDRQADNFAILSFVCAVLLLADPYMLYNVGFQLSFIVTFGLFIGLWILEKITAYFDDLVPEEIDENLKLKLFGKELKFSIKSVLGGTVAMIIIPVIAQIWATPIQAYHFNSFSPYSVLANILVVPFVEIVSFLGFTGSTLGLIPVIGGKICALSDFILKPLVILIYKIAEFFATKHDAILYCKQPSIPLIISFYLSVILLCFAIKYNFKKKALNSILATLILVSGIIAINSFVPTSLGKIVFFDTQQNDSTLIVTPNKTAILVNTGSGGRFSTAKTAIVPYLIDLGVENIDILVYSAYSEINLISLKNIKSGRNVKEIILPKARTEKEKHLFESVKKIAKINPKMAEYSKISLTDLSKIAIKKGDDNSIDVEYYDRNYSLLITNTQHGQVSSDFDTVKFAKSNTLIDNKKLYSPKTLGAVEVVTDKNSYKLTNFLKK